MDKITLTFHTNSKFKFRELHLYSNPSECEGSIEFDHSNGETTTKRFIATSIKEWQVEVQDYINSKK